MSRIIIETNQVEGIPILTFAPEEAERCPIVFFIHGFTGEKAEGAQLGYQLATVDIVCVCVDAAMHGQRLDDRLLQVLDPGHAQVYPAGSNLDALYLQAQITLQTAADISQLMSYFAVDPRIDSNRVGVAGESMGGLVVYYLAANHPGVKTAVPLISIPYFVRYWEDAVLEAGLTEAGATTMRAVADVLEMHTAFFRRIDPMDKLETFAPKPLLMILGDKDTNAYKFGTVELYRRLAPAYRNHRERLQLRIYPNTDHRVTRDMIRDACQWFRQHLL